MTHPSNTHPTYKSCPMLWLKAITLLSLLAIMGSCGKKPPTQAYSSFSYDGDAKVGTFAFTYNKWHGGEAVDLVAKPEDKDEDKDKKEENDKDDKDKKDEEAKKEEKKHLNPKVTMTFNDHSWDDVELYHELTTKAQAEGKNKLDNYSVVKLVSAHFATAADKDDKTTNLFEALTADGVDKKRSVITLSLEGNSKMVTFKGDAFKNFVLLFAAGAKVGKTHEKRKTFEEYVKLDSKKPVNEQLRGAFDYTFLEFVALFPRKDVTATK